MELEYRVENKQATPLTESMVVPFSINIRKPVFRLGQVGSTIDPTRDIAEGANRELWCVDRWVDVSDDRSGLAIVPKDMPLVSIGNVGIYRFEAGRVPEEPVVYAHLANTQWGTNFPQWLEGDFRFRVALDLHAGDWRKGALWKNSPSMPELSMNVIFRAGVMPIEVKEKPGDGLVLMALRPRHDGPGVIARYWDAVGMHGGYAAKLGEAVTRVWLCDLMERPVRELQVRQVTNADGKDTLVFFTCAPHGIVTLLVEFD
nr:Unknown Function [uncultured bacterium]